MSALNQVSAHATALIAVGGTLLGALVAGSFGLMQGRRTQRSQRSDAWLRLYDERGRILWTERRALYGRMVKVSQDLKTVIAVEGLEDLPVAECGCACTAIAESKRRYDAIEPKYEAFLATMGELYIVGGGSVANLALELHAEFQKAIKVAVDGKLSDELAESLTASVAGLMSEMRKGALRMHPSMKEALVKDGVLPSVRENMLRDRWRTLLSRSATGNEPAD